MSLTWYRWNIATVRPEPVEILSYTDKTVLLANGEREHIASRDYAPTFNGCVSKKAESIMRKIDGAKEILLGYELQLESVLKARRGHEI